MFKRITFPDVLPWLSDTFYLVDDGFFNGLTKAPAVRGIEKSKIGVVDRRE